MEKESKDFLVKLLSQNGPSGFEENPAEIWRERTLSFVDEIPNTDVLGNTIAVINKDAPFKVMLAGHVDEIGFIVTHINKEGFVYVEAIGGIDKVVVPGSHVIIITESGEVEGIIGKKAIHLDKESKAIPVKDIYIDVGGVNETIEVGDPVAFKPNFTQLSEDIFSSKGCDDRVGAFVVSEVMRLLQPNAQSLLDNGIGVYGVATVQEEVGLRGARTSASRITPDVGFAIDVTFSSDTPGASKTELGDVKLGEGGVLHAGPANNRKLLSKVIQTAKDRDIPYQLQANGYPSGTDTASIQMSGKGAATILLSIPNRYMHTQVETCSLVDLVNTSKLIAETILRLHIDYSNFIPNN